MRLSCAMRAIGRALVAVAATAVCFLADRAVGQDKVVDTKAYKEAKRSATATFLDREQPKERRLAAAKNLGYPDEKTFDALLELAADKEQDDDIRWEALRRHRHNDKFLQLVLKILDDPADGGAELDARLIENIARRTTLTRSPKTREQVITVLRKLLKDPRDKVRLNAFRVLATSHDAVAVGMLTESLKNREGFPIPLAEAIDLLDADGSVNHIGVLRPYLTHKEPRVQGLAARALAIDRESRPKIVELVKERRVADEVRLPAVRGLAGADDGFARYGLGILENGQEDPKIRYAIMQGFVGRMNNQQVAPADQVRFAQIVEKVASDNTLKTVDGRKLKEGAEQLFVYLRKNFPEVQKHYDNR